MVAIQVKGEFGAFQSCLEFHLVRCKAYKRMAEHQAAIFKVNQTMSECIEVCGSL